MGSARYYDGMPLAELCEIILLEQEEGYRYTFWLYLHKDEIHIPRKGNDTRYVKSIVRIERSGSRWRKVVWDLDNDVCMAVGSWQNAAAEAPASD